MIAVFPEEIIIDRLQRHFAALDPRCIDERGRAFLEDIRQDFAELYETLFVVFDNEGGKPFSTEILTDRRTADDCARVCGPRASVGILLIPR